MVDSAYLSGTENVCVQEIDFVCSFAPRQYPLGYFFRGIPTNTSDGATNSDVKAALKAIFRFKAPADKTRKLSPMFHTSDKVWL